MFQHLLDSQVEGALVDVHGLKHHINALTQHNIQVCCIRFYCSISNVIISNITTVFLISQQVGNILNSHVTYGGILPPNQSTDFLQCFRKYIQNEEQWLFHILAENTGTTQVSTRCLYVQLHRDFMTGLRGKGLSLSKNVIERILYYIDFDSLFSNFHG